MKNYIVKVADASEHKFDSLKAARNFIRSLINVNEIKGIEEVYELYKETVKRKKIDQAKSNPQNVGKIGKVFG